VLVLRPSEGSDILKVTDFGLAIEVDRLLGWVESGGDLAYLAPECFSHNLSSPQSDVYMLGLIFYEMVTGANPFAEVGSHLRGSDERHHEELRRLHLQARQLERFTLLERHDEVRQYPRLAQVIRTALAPDMASRTYANADELYAAWREALRAPDASRPAARPWHRVGELTAQAEQCIAAGDRARGQELLLEAMRINRDPRQVPDQMAVGKCYLKQVELLLGQGKEQEATELATEGYRRRVCRSTCLARARCYRSQGSPAAAGLEAQAVSCGDQQ
jgi:serine/threonine protein kinase